MNTMTEVECRAAYYQACAEKRRPEWVPATVNVLREVRADLPLLRGAVLQPGAVAVQCNQWGAVSAVASDGNLLGLRPGEFEVLTWREAAV